MVLLAAKSWWYLSGHVSLLLGGLASRGGGVRCFALFPPPGGTCAETPAAPGLGDEGAIGPGLGDTEPGVASGWVQEGLADSGTVINE